MVRLTSITTKTGDQGQTSLGDGQRRPKHDRRIEAYGAVDEANSAIGLARALMGDRELAAILAYVQNDLFDLGADLCVPPQQKEAHGNGQKALRISPDHTSRIEADLVRLNADLPPLDSFILPAGDGGVAALHLARTITRRAEREMSALNADDEGGSAAGGGVGAEAIRYINRLSDLLFIMARCAARGKEEKWVPKK